MTSAMEFNLRTDVTQSEMAIYDAKGRKFLTTWDAYDPERWRVLCEPCYYENRYSDWGHYVHCLVCEKQATDGHLASHKHRERVEGQLGAKFREEYRDAIRAGKIPMPTDGLNRRNSFGNVDNLRGEGPHPVDLEFVPTPFRPFDAPAPALAMNGFTTSTAGGSSSSSSPQLARGASSGNAGNTQLALVGEVRNVELRLDENGELPKLTMAEMEKLQPIDCHGRPIPKTHWLWKGDFYEGYLLELFKNPHFYELINLGDWPELRCRLCPRNTKCTESHTPGSNEHKKNLRHFCEGMLTMKHQDRAESEALEKATNRAMPKPLKPSEIREGLHLPVGFRHYGQFLAVGDEGLVAENQVEVLCSPAGSSAVSPGTRKGIGKKGMSQRAMLTNTVADALTSSAITNASASSCEQEGGDARLLLQQLRAKFARREKELQDEVIQLRKQVSDGEKAVRFRQELLAVFASREAEKCAELFTLKDLTIITPLMTAALEIKKAEQQEQKKLELQDTITMKKPMENKGGKRPVGGGSSRSGGSSLNTSRLQMNDVAGALGDGVDGDRQLNEAYGNYDGAMDVEEDHNASRAQSVRPPYGGFAAQSHSKLLDADGRGSVSRRQHQVAVEQAQGRNQLSAQRPNGYSAEPPVVNSGKQGACRLPPGLDGLHHERHAPCFYYPHGALEVEDEEHNLHDYPMMNIVQLQPGSKTTYESLPSNTSSSVDPEGDPEDHEDRTASCWGVVDAWRDFCNDDGSSKGEGRRKDTNQESHLLHHHGGSISSSSECGNNLNHNRNSSSSSSNWKDKNGYGYHNYHTDSSSSSWHNYNNQMNQKQPKGLLSQSSAEFID